MKRLKQISAIFLAVLLIFTTIPFSVGAAVVKSGTCGDKVTWVLDDSGLLTISGTGDMYDYNFDTTPPWKDSERDIKAIIIENGVTNIGTYAFFSCCYLENISISDTVTSIGTNAFVENSLTSITIPASVTSIGDRAITGNCLTDIKVANDNKSFCDMDGILFSKDKTVLVQYPLARKTSEYIIPGSIKTIGNYALSTFNLKSVTIPNGVTVIGDYAFYCSGITGKFIIPDSVISIGDYAFSNCCNLNSVKFSENLKTIGSFAFSGCHYLTDLVLPHSLTTIDVGAFFYSGDEIESITIPGSVKSISQEAFRLFSVKNVIIEDGVETIENSAFFGCSAASVSLGNTVKTIGSNAFYNLYELTEITIPKSVESIDYSAFSNCFYLTDVTIESGNADSPLLLTSCFGLTAIKNLTVGRNLETPNPGASPFLSSKIENITFLEGVTKIGGRMFSSLSSLKNINFPESLESIGEDAFFICSGLTQIELNKNLKTIGDKAFANCQNLTDVTIFKNVTSIGEDAFINCKNLTISCYKGSYAEEYAIAHEIPVKYISDEAETEADIFVFKMDNPNAYYVNANLTLPVGSSVQYYNNKTYVPFRAVAAAVGINDLKFDSATGLITFTGAMDCTVKMAVGSSKCEITAPDGNKMSLTIGAPVNIGGSTCLPVRDVSILTGGSVKFDESGYVVVSPAEIDDSKIAEYISAYKNNVK